MARDFSGKYLLLQPRKGNDITPVRDAFEQRLAFIVSLCDYHYNSMHCDMIGKYPYIVQFVINSVMSL